MPRSGAATVIVIALASATVADAMAATIAGTTSPSADAATVTAAVAHAAPKQPIEKERSVELNGFPKPSGRFPPIGEPPKFDFEFPETPVDEFDPNPMRLEENPAFVKILGVLESRNEFLAKQCDAFSKYCEDSHRSAQSAWRWSFASLLVALASLFIAAISPLSQFHVICG